MSLWSAQTQHDPSYIVEKSTGFLKLGVKGASLPLYISHTINVDQTKGFDSNNVLTIAFYKCSKQELLLKFNLNQYCAWMPVKKYTFSEYGRCFRNPEDDCVLQASLHHRFCQASAQWRSFVMTHGLICDKKIWQCHLQVVLKRETLSCFCCCSSPHACWSPCRSWTLARKSASRWIQVMFFVQRNDTNVHNHQNNQSFFFQKRFCVGFDPSLLQHRSCQ